MRTYLECCRRKGNPKVALEVCKKCKFNETCSVYYAYRNPSLFEATDKRPRSRAT